MIQRRTVTYVGEDNGRRTLSTHRRTRSAAGGGGRQCCTERYDAPHGGVGVPDGSDDMAATGRLSGMYRACFLVIVVDGAKRGWNEGGMGERG